MHETISVRVDADNPDHHLWQNGKTWWIHYTVHTDDGRQRRVRYSLHTRDPERARMLRDAVLTVWLQESGGGRSVPMNRTSNEHSRER